MVFLMIGTKRIVVFGFGAQGSAQAKNLADGRRNVSVFLREKSPRIEFVKKEGIHLITDIGQAAGDAEIAVILLPDGEQVAALKDIESLFPKNAAVIFAHGFNIHYGLIAPRKDLDIILVGPMAQGEMLRRDFIAGKGTPCQIAIAQDATGRAKEIAFEYARSIARDGPFIETTFAEETEADLFSEQVVLCGGLFELMRAAFDTLIEAGYNPDIAYFCCVKEVRALANLAYEHGIAGARERISDTALFGDLTRGPRVIDGHVRTEMKKILDDIKSGRFKDDLSKDRKNENRLLRSLLERDKNHLIEKIHRKFKGGGE